MNQSTRLARSHRHAFTLLELLIVITIIVILIALLMPAFEGSTARARTAQCLGNMRQLSAAWASFAADHDGNFPVSETGAGCWVLSGSGTAPIEGGTLFPYVKDVKVYQCPAAKQLEPHNERSYSVSGRLNSTWAGGTHNTADRLAKLTPAAQCLLLVEEYDYRGGFNNGSWVINPAPSNNWVDYPSSWHQNGINLSFCDGHAEHWTWVDTGTKDLATKVKTFFANGVSTNSLNDLRRMQAIYKP